MQTPQEKNDSPITHDHGLNLAAASSSASLKKITIFVGRFRWVICGLLFLGVTKNYMDRQVLGVLKVPLQQQFGWNDVDYGNLVFVFQAAYALGMLFVGSLIDRLGTRPVVLSGAVLLGTGLCLASRSTSLIEFQLTYGIVVGIAAGAFFAPMIAAATRWFDSNRSLAVSLVSAGMGVAPMTISPLARWLISTYDWRSAMMTVGIIAWALLIPAALLVRQPPETASSGAPGRRLPCDPRSYS